MKKYVLGIIFLFMIFLLGGCQPKEENFTKLDTPTISKQNDNSVKWTSIDNAIGYDLDIDGRIVTLSKTSYEVEEYGVYKFKVRAKADENSLFLTSDWSAEFELDYKEKEDEVQKTPLSPPVIDKVDHATIYWLPVAYAKGYRVFINGVAISPDLSSETTSFSIEGKEFGVYQLKVIALPAEDSDYSESEFSNEITLELVDTIDYLDRITITVLGKPEIIKGEEADYEVDIVDKDGADVSFLLDEIVWNLETKPANTTIVDGKVSTENVGEVKIVASLKDHPEVKGELIVNVIERPTFMVALDVYDKSSDENKATLQIDFGGKIHYINSLETIENVEQLLLTSYFSVSVSKEDTEFLIDFGKPEGSLVDLYFVFEYQKDGYSIGYSEILTLKEVEMLVEKVMVTNQEELKAALDSNKEYIILSNDIVITESWKRVNTVFTGVLDGNNHFIKELLVEGGGTGLIKTLGDGATFINIVFDSPVATNFSGANDGIVASTVLAGSKVLFENVALLNALSISNIDGSSRSTHASLIATFNDPNDTELSVTLRNVYIEYTHHVTRKTDTANTGAVFGTFVSNSPNGLILDNVYINATMLSDTNKMNNSAALIGQGRGHIQIDNSVIIFKFDSADGGINGVDIGYISGGFDPTIIGSNNIVISTANLNAEWPVGSYLKSNIGLLLGDQPFMDLIDVENDFWEYDAKKLCVNVAGLKKLIPIGEQLDQPVISRDGNNIVWEDVENATGYEVYIDDVLYGSILLESPFNFSLLEPNIYNIKIKALGDDSYYIDSEFSDAIEIVLEPNERLAKPIVELNGQIASWTAVPNAVGYKVFINDLAISEEILGTNFDLSPHLEKGLYKIEVQALANPSTHLDSFLSDSVEIVLAVLVSTQQELWDALYNNDYHIILTNDITLTGVWSRINTVFTGVLDGGNYTIKDLVVEGGGTGLIRTLGDGAKFMNVTFDNPTAQNFSGGNDGIIASSVEKGAQVLFKNFALINAKSLSSVAGSSRSTHGALIANYNDATDTEISIKLSNVYIDYTHYVSRATDTSNVGGLFGTFVSTSPNAIILEGVYLDIKLISDVAKINNAGAIFGMGTGYVSIDDSIIRFVYKSAVAGTNGFEGGYFAVAMTPVFSGGNNIFITSTSTIKGDWDLNDNIVLSLAANLEASDAQSFANNNSYSWAYEVDNLVIMVGGTKHPLFIEQQLPTTILSLQDNNLTWDLVDDATGYLLHVDDIPMSEVLTTNTFDVFTLSPGTYQIKIQVIGDYINNYSSELSSSLEVVVPAHDQLAAPILEENEGILTWNEVEHAIGYKIYLNDEVLVENTLATTYDLTGEISFGYYKIQVQALADLNTHLSSELSNIIEIKNAVKVGTQQQLKDALDANEGYIMLISDIMISGVWSRVNTVFTGILDGDGYTIYNLVVEGGGTGLIKTLGNGATFINITFDSPTAQNFSGANNGIIASSVEKGAQVVFENFALVNASSLSSVAGGSRSTHGALIASYKDTTDTEISIKLTNVYIDYTHHVSRETDTANVGGLFGTFISSSENAIILDSVYLDIKIISDTAKITNVGAIFGGGSGYIKVNNSVIKYMIDATSTSQSGFDGGYFDSSTTTDFSGKDNVFVNNGVPIKGNWEEGDYLLLTEVIEDDYEAIKTRLEKSTYWNISLDNVYLTINNEDYLVIV